LHHDQGVSAAEALSCGQSGTAVSDNETPLSRSGFYYVVRGRNEDGAGSWGTAARNSQIDACD
jgi:hypothetical protein